MGESAAEVYRPLPSGTGSIGFTTRCSFGCVPPPPACPLLPGCPPVCCLRRSVRCCRAGVATRSQPAPHLSPRGWEARSGAAGSRPDPQQPQQPHNVWLRQRHGGAASQHAQLSSSSPRATCQPGSASALPAAPAARLQPAAACQENGWAGRQRCLAGASREDSRFCARLCVMLECPQAAPCL